MRTGRSFRALCVLLAMAALALGQSDRGTVSGTVLDKSGAVIPGAKVTVTNAATNLVVQLTSNDAGEFTAPSLEAGQYNIRVEKDGFRPTVLSNLTLNAASSVHADIALEVGTTNTAVEVQASAIQLQTEDAKTSVAVTNKLVDELPLVVGGAIRSPFDLANITPEAKPLGGDNGFILGGGQAAGYGTNLDGVSANTTRALSQSWVAVNAPSVEAITEFTVDTNGFKAEYGHASGGVMNFVSKSGTNDFHGNGYEFLRNDAVDANNWFNNALNRPKPVYKQHDYGGTFGGYAWIPKIYNGKNKTFFFASYEAFRNRAGATSASATVPTAEMYDGDFSKWVDASGKMIPIYDPTTQITDAAGNVTRQPFAGNIIPKSKFDPIATKALAAYTANGVLKPNNGAAPGSIGYVNNNYFIAAGSEVRPQTKFSIKGDHILNEKHRFGGYYGYNRSSVVPSALGPATLPGLYTNYNDTQRNSDVYRMSWDWTLSPTKFNHFYAGANNWRENHDPPQATVKSGINWKDKVCLGNVPDCGQNLLNFDFSNGYTSWGGRANNGSENTIFSYNDDFTWIKGKHNFKAGGQYQNSHYNGFGRQCISGCATFSFIGTGRPGDTNFATAGGNPFASMLLGWATGGSIDTIRFIAQQWPYFAGYFQDDYKFSQKLTINVGLRWETQLPPVEANDRWSDFSPTTPNPKASNIPGALLYAGTGDGRQGTRSLADSYWKAWGPRLGMAYQWNEKTVIRASWGISYGAITTVSGSTHQRGFTQTYGVSSANNGISPAFQMSQGFPSYPIPPFIDPSFANKDNIPWWQGSEATRPPAMNSFNLSIQRQFKGNTVLELGYNGVLGSRLQSGLLNYNQIDPKYLFTLGPTVLNSRIDSPAGIASGVKIPYANFIADWGSNATVARALRPFPQYNGIDTANGGGDHSGHSTYHAVMVRAERRYSGGFTLLTSYVFSKLLTDSDGYWVGGSAMDHFNRKLEKSIGQYDVPHNFKLSGIYELPFGKGKKFLTNGGLADAAFGGWRLSGIGIYTSGQPVGLGTTISNPIFAGSNRPTISTYDGWQGNTASGSFNPFTDRFFQPASFFGTQPTIGFGNMTRYNPKLRQFNNLNENVSLGKSFRFTERVKLDFRAEAFNIFNRHRFGTGSWTLQDQNFGKLTSSADLLNTPRQMQFGLKLSF